MRQPQQAPQPQAQQERWSLASGEGMSIALDMPSPDALIAQLDTPGLGEAAAHAVVQKWSAQAFNQAGVTRTITALQHISREQMKRPLSTNMARYFGGLLAASETAINGDFHTNNVTAIKGGLGITHLISPAKA